MRVSRRLVAAVVGGIALSLLGGPAAASTDRPARTQATTRALASALPAAPVGKDVGLGLLGRGEVRLGVVLRGDSSGAVGTARAHGAVVAHRLPSLGYLSLSVPRTAVDAVTAALSRRSEVLSVAPVARRHATTTPDDALWSDQSPYLTAIAAPAAWDVTHGSAGVKVAVIDSGVDVAHPDLAGKLAGVHNAMATAPTPTDVTDTAGHGTHVAGTIGAASGNATGIAGVGYDTALLAVKAGDENGFTDDDIAAGILWATDQDAKVINMSLGGPQTSSVLSQAVSAAQTAGVLVVAAAGNEHSTNPSYPAALPGVVSVGATDAVGGIAPFSNYGSHVTVGAPGVNIWSTVPTAGSTGFGAAGSGYDRSSGTSMASPIVAGEAALLFAASPAATTAQVRNAIVSTAHGYAGLGLGTGQVDLAAALTKLPPATTPGVTAPEAAAQVAGATALTATSSAPKVQFRVDGSALGAPVVVTSGTASTTWQSWGVADGAHEVSASDCNDTGCGTPSGGVAVTVQNPAPVVTAPTSGATVSGVVALDVTTYDAVPKVRVRVDGALVASGLSVSGNAAHVSWPTGGYANASHSIEVAACDAIGRCGSTSSTSVTVANAAPVITSPKVGQVPSGAFALAATATSGAVRFLLDGKEVGFDTTSPYGVTVNFSAYPGGDHTLLLQPCTVSRSLCAGPSVSRVIKVRSLHPSITKAVPTVFSPNGDKRADSTTVSYYLPTTQSAWWSIRSNSGATVRGPYYLGTFGAGTRTFLWNGNLGNGTRAPDGYYTAVVTTKATSGSSTLYGMATKALRVDTVAPTLSISGMATGFYPYTDGYRDTLAPKATVNEAGLLTMVVRNSSGTLVRTITVNHSGTGAYTLTWNGRNASGYLVPAGTYKAAVTAQDVALNRRSSTAYSVVVSLKKLVGTTVTKVVTPAATKTHVMTGACSAVAADSEWSGGYVYLSDYYCNDPNSTSADVAMSLHSFTLPAAAKYGGISVGVTGKAACCYGYVGYAAYLDTDDYLVEPVVVLGSQYGTRSIGTAATSLLQGGNVLRWMAGANGGSRYAVQSFTVKYTYYVLA